MRPDDDGRAPGPVATAARAVAAFTVAQAMFAGTALAAGPDTMLDRAQRAAETTVATLTARGLPGALVGLSSGSGEARRLAIGEADVTTGAPLQRDHVMRIGSVAKPIVATLVLQLAAEGRIGLDDPVSAHVAGIPGGDRITPRMLGGHRSGLFNPIADPVFRGRINAAPAAELAFSDIIDVVRAHPGSVTPGTAFSYSNANTVLLARIVETVTGRPLSAVIDERIRRPLGITTPVIPATAALPDADLRGYRHGARAGAVEYGAVFFDATSFSASWAGAAGNMNARLDDLMVLAKPLAAGALLSEEMRTVLHDFAPVAPGFDYGFHMARFGDAVGHAGDVPGFSSFVAWHPNHDLVIVVLCNLSNLSDKRAPAEIIGRGIIDALGEPGDER